MLNDMHEMAQMFKIKKKRTAHLYPVTLGSKLCRTGRFGMSKLITD